MSQALPPKSTISTDVSKEALEGDRSVKAASIPSLMGESFKDILREMKGGFKDDGSIGMSSTAKEKPPLMSKDDEQIGMFGFAQERQEVMKDFQDAVKKIIFLAPKYQLVNLQEIFTKLDLAALKLQLKVLTKSYKSLPKGV